MSRPTLKEKAKTIQEQVVPLPITTVAELGKLIRTARRAKGLRLNEFAALCNVGQRFMMELEGGKETVQFDKVLHVLRFLGIGIVAMPEERAQEEEHS